MKSGSRAIIPTSPSNGVKSIKILSQLRSEKEALCFFYSSEGPAYWKILGEGETVYFTFFCKQLEKMTARVSTSHMRQVKILLLMDNARPHHAKIAQQKLQDLGMEWISHPTSLHAISLHFEARKTSAADGTSKTDMTWSSSCGPGSQQDLKTSAEQDSNNRQNDGEQS